MSSSPAAPGRWAARWWRSSWARAPSATCRMPMPACRLISRTPATNGSGSSHNVDLADAGKVDAFYASRSRNCGLRSISPAASPARRSRRPNPAVFAEMMDTNVRTTFLCCRAAVRSMLASGIGGRIVNVIGAAGARSAPRRRHGRLYGQQGGRRGNDGGDGRGSCKRARASWSTPIAPSTLDTPANREAMPDADFDSWVSLEAAAETVAALVSTRNLATSGALLPLYGKV